jgi:hypothetical protein
MGTRPINTQIIDLNKHLSHSQEQLNHRKAKFKWNYSCQGLYDQKGNIRETLHQVCASSFLFEAVLIVRPA